MHFLIRRVILVGEILLTLKDKYKNYIYKNKHTQLTITYFIAFANFIERIQNEMSFKRCE